ncbi:MAG: phage portal protein, partial [Gemmatimonadales bacterium]
MNLLRRIGQWLRGLRGRYEGAVTHSERSIVPGALTSPRFDMTAHSRQEIARKARYFEKNSTLVQALVGKFENFVVGAHPQITPNSSDPEWNKRAKIWWDEWAHIPDIASRQSFGCLLNLMARNWFIDGEIFIILTKGESFTANGAVRQFPRIQLIEGHLCRTPPNLDKDPSVVDGVRLDRRGRPVSYYFAEEVRQGQYEFRTEDADNVIHLFEPSRPGQVRGLSFLHAAINELHDVDDLLMLEMQAARENASTSVWIKTKSGDLDPGEVRRARLIGTTVTNTGGTATETKAEYYRDVSGGRARVLKTGDEVNQNAGERPSVTSVGYWKLKIELICAGVEIPYVIIFPDSMQGTVYRGALDMATSFFRSRHAVIAEVARRIYAYVMRFATAMDRGLASRPGDFTRVSILPPRAPNVDVGRNAAAEAEALKDGRMNYDLIFGPQGLSWTDELLKFNEQLEFIEANCPALAKHIAAQ